MSEAASNGDLVGITASSSDAGGGVVTYSSTVFIGDGKRSAAVVAIDDAAIPASAIKKLAKVAAKKMK